MLGYVITLIIIVLVTYAAYRAYLKEKAVKAVSVIQKPVVSVPAPAPVLAPVDVSTANTESK